jgi:hypothetical protein
VKKQTSFNTNNGTFQRSLDICFLLYVRSFKHQNGFSLSRLISYSLDLPRMQSTDFVQCPSYPTALLFLSRPPCLPNPSSHMSAARTADAHCAQQPVSQDKECPLPPPIPAAIIGVSLLRPMCFFKQAIA